MPCWEKTAPGKSTLMRQLYGLYQPDEGEILIDGKPLQLRSPADAIRAGIGMIHQHFMLVPTLTVAQNVALGQRSSRAPLLDLDACLGAHPGAGRGIRSEGGAQRVRLAAVGGRAAARRDHEGALPRRPPDHPRRADRGADAAGGRRPVRHPAAHGAGRALPGVHLPQAAGSHGHQRPRDGAARREGHWHAAHAGRHPGRARADDGRPGDR